VESAKVSAKIDKIIEKRQFPMIFLQKVYFINITYIPTDHNNKNWNILKKMAKKLNSPSSITHTKDKCTAIARGDTKCKACGN
jgi:hypothetical protein